MHATISDATTDPRLQVRLYKCDGTAMSEDKSCHIRVGSYSGSYSSSLNRRSFTWSEGDSYTDVSFDGWPSRSDFEDDEEGSEKELYIICEESAGDWNHWRSENPIVVEKTCAS